MRLLRSMRDDDIELVRQHRNRPEIMRWLRQSEEITKDQQVYWWNKEKFNGNHFHFVIGQNIGYCALRVDSRHLSAEFSIITYGHTNLGYFGLRELLTFGFRDRGLNRIWSDVIADNPALKLYNLMGFKNEGMLRKAYLKDEAWKDSVVIGLLKEEYKIKQNDQC